MLLTNAALLPELLICTWTVDVDPTCVGVKITAVFVPNVVLAEPITAENVSVVPRPTLLRLNELSPTLKRALNIPG